MKNSNAEASFLDKREMLGGNANARRTANMKPLDTRPPEYFQRCDGYACYAPVGVVSQETAVQRINSALIFAREQKIKRLLVDATQLTGFPSPSVVDRYWIVGKWVEASRCLVESAFVLQRHLIDPEKFGVQVAINRGMRADVFETRNDALSWLLSGARPRLIAAKILENDQSKQTPSR